MNTFLDVRNRGQPHRWAFVIHVSTCTTSQLVIDLFLRQVPNYKQQYKISWYELFLEHLVLLDIGV